MREGKKHCKWYNDEFCTNGESPCVADYCPVVEYPELCKHRETGFTKDINALSKEDTEIDVGMIEKSVLFDQELNKEQCVWLLKGSIWKTYKLSEVLDLIHSLQSEKEKPKSKKILANRVYSDSTLKGWKKEDLIEQIRILEHNWAAAEESLNIQAKNCEMLLKQKEKDTAKEIYSLLDTMKVPEDGRHQWRDNNNDCIDRCKSKIKECFGVEVE